MGEPVDDNVSDLGFLRPFEMSATRYLDAGWWPIVVPYGSKSPPATGFTGHTSAWPDEEQIKEWSDKDNWNVAFHLGPVVPPSERGFRDRHPDWTCTEWLDDDGSPRWTVVGIDVDDYEDGGKIKEGFSQLKKLEKQFGKLPETWTSSSRDDGKSGIRYFLAPAKYGYRGKAAEHIDVIQQGHRYAMAWPSRHPNGGQYTWFRPGHAPQGKGASGFAITTARRYKSGGASQLRFVPVDVVPLVWTLPILPEPWVEHITDGFTLHEGYDIDMDSSVDEVWQWLESHALNDPDGDPCKLMRKRKEQVFQAIEEDATSHDKITDGHWNVLAMALEGHSGWRNVLSEMETFWLKDVGERGKRDLGSASSELFRSRTNAVRKLKAQADAGKRGLPEKCGCYNAPPPEDTSGEFVLSGEPKDPGDYDPNDVGNGEHFIDLYGGPEGNFRFISKVDKWMVWTDRWSIDEDNDLSARAFGVVQQRQKAYVEHVKAQWAAAKASEEKEEAALLSLEMKEWNAHAKNGGNVGKIRSSLEAARDVRGVRVPYDLPDSKYHLLGVDNGVIELDIHAKPNEPAFSLRQVEKEDWVLTNTGIPYLPIEDQLKAGGELAKGVRAWADYLELFLPDPEIRAWTQQLLGYCLYGRNVEKKFIFLFGQGGTGKTTILNAVMGAIGSYAGSFEMSMFAAERFNPALLRAFPMRIITTTEAGGTANLNAESMKRVTGNDPMSPERKGTDEIIEMTPAFVPIVGTNNPPQLGNIDQALQNRLEVVPFDVAMPTSEAGSDLIEVARHAVLAWLLDGWSLYVRHRLKNKPMEKLKESQEAFSLGMAGTIGSFLSDCCTITGDHLNDFEPNGALYETYMKWSRVNNISESKVWSKPTFLSKLTEAGVGVVKNPRRVKGYDSVQRCRSGIQLQDGLDDVATFKMKKV